MSLVARMHRLVKQMDRSNSGRSEGKIFSSDFSAAAALAKMAGKKKGGESLSLQIEVETEMQWRTLLRREGLIVCDVYAGWAGPCTSMISILKRVKVDVNDDRLWLAIANSDNISDLLMFKDQSEPTWLFIGGGKPVKVFRGSNAPKLVNLIKAEFENELLCMQGKAKRTLISIDDEVSRRKKAEAEAQKLAKMIKDEDEAAKELNQLRKDSSLRLMGAMEPYTVLVIQSFLLETGAVTEIRDYLLGEFKIEQERYVSLSEDGVRQLFRIPKEIPDTNEPTDFGYVDTEEESEAQGGFSDTAGEGNAEDAEGSQIGSAKNSMADDGGEEDGGYNAGPKGPKQKRKKMISIPLPPGLVGDTLIMLLESVEIRKMMAAGKKPDVESLLQTADDYIQLKVGPVDYKDALEHAPYSLHAIYGTGQYTSGVWCPRRYDDKRFVMINYFPRFVTEMLMPPPAAAPKYFVAIFPAAKAAQIHSQLEAYKKDLLADGKFKLPPEAIEEMLKSNNLTGDKYESKKKIMEGQVYAVSVDRRNSEIMIALHANDPVHMSADRTYGRSESAKLFEQLNIKLDAEPNPDAVVEKFLARSNKRIESTTEMEPKLPRRTPKDRSKSVTQSSSRTTTQEKEGPKSAAESAPAKLSASEPPALTSADSAAPPASEGEPATQSPSETSPEVPTEEPSVPEMEDNIAAEKGSEGTGSPPPEEAEEGSDPGMEGDE